MMITCKICSPSNTHHRRMWMCIPQVKLEHPADIQGSVSLRGEEDGFFGHSVASCLQVGRPLTSS